MLELYITKIIKSLIFPPGNFLLLVLLGLLLLRSKPVAGKVLLWIGLLTGYLLSTPLLSGLLLQQVQIYQPLSEAEIRQTSAQAIVVLSAGRNSAPEYDEADTVDNTTLVRVRYGAYLQRATGLPVLVSGGRVFESEGQSLAAMMAESLRQDFQIETVWEEGQSRTTAENAQLSKLFLQDKDIDTVLLVTDATHMPRAVAIFERVGFQVIPAPTRFTKMPDSWWLLLLPDAGAVDDSYYALHELTGRVWYIIRH